MMTSSELKECARHLGALTAAVPRRLDPAGLVALALAADEVGRFLSTAEVEADYLDVRAGLIENTRQLVTTLLAMAIRRSTATA
jgi:hypothetical protein